MEAESGVNAPEGFTGLCLAGNEGMEKKTEKKIETIILGYSGTTIGIHSLIPSYPKASLVLWEACSSRRVGGLGL